MTRKCGLQVQNEENGFSPCGEPMTTAFAVSVYITLRDLEKDENREPAILSLCQKHAQEGLRA